MKATRYSRLLKALTLVTLLAAGSAQAAERYVFISHAPDSDSWWSVVRNSLKGAAEDFKVSVDYRNPPTGDLADMARLIEQAAAQNYDGVVTTIADFNVLQGAIQKITDKHIPLITANSGTAEQSDKLGAIMHVGQEEYAAGFGAGERAKQDGVKSFVCVNHYATNPASFERCRGFGDALGVDFKTSTIDTGIDPAQIEAMTSAYLRRNPGTQAIFTLGPVSAQGALQAVKKMDLKGKIYFATMDLSNEISRGIKDGTIAFAVDQQPYLQGYIPIAIMAIMKQSGNTDLAAATAAFKANPVVKKRLEGYGLNPIYGPRNISSGPGFVTRDNIQKVERYSGQYR
ncbi:sugar ABC transporter substrate-binding protein [Castellaniella sp.]|uniref:sugar ABC transporter substrate-binding protein n=1 Tax=Castellaniella sp. TaxID=1955812 RepID=UPI002B0033C1|nr:sugar ABC transporter substrate-binding protein [Castellaniella sp.]